MATVDVVGRGLRVRFSWWERFAVMRGEVVVPLAAVRLIEHVERPLARTRGGRAGFLVSGVMKVGVWGFGKGVRQLVSVRRTVPALRVTLDRPTSGLRFDELLISTTEAALLAKSITDRRAADQ